MSCRLDWSKPRKAPRPLVTDGERRDFTRSAKAMAERASKGWRSPQAHLHGEVRRLTPDEIRAVEARLRSEGRL